MSSDRNIEKLLRALRKRRADAHERMDLHPANRRLLHAEVRKVHAAPRQSRPARWVYWVAPVFGMLVVMALLGALILPRFSNTKHQTEMALSSEKERKDMEPVASASSALSAPTENMGDIDRFAGRDVSPSSPAIADEERAPQQTGQSEGYVVGDDQQELSTFAKNKPHAETDKQAASGVLPSHEAFLMVGRSLPEVLEVSGPALMFFQRVSSDANKESAEPAILFRFELRQTASNLLVIDGDGSIYASREVGKTEMLAGGRSARRESFVNRSEATSAGDRIELLSFEVSGTNRTLSQPVVFNGTLFSSSNSLTRFGGGTGTTVANVSGTAVVGSSVLSVEAIQFQTNGTFPNTNK